MEYKLFGKISVVLVFSLVACIGCAPLVKTTLDSYLENQDYYKGKKVVFTTDLDDLLDRYELYRNKAVELTAPLAYFGERKFRTWYLILEKNGKKIRCYESRYRNYPGHDAVNLLLQARSEGGEVTVRGVPMYDGIELDQLAYKNSVVFTNYNPYINRHRYYYGSYY